jgi:uncharacterized membrane protein (DUF4010 family)
MTESELFPRMALALAIGLAVGAERGWQKREAPEGTRVAGIRTFALLGLLGGVLGALVPVIGPLGIGLAFMGLSALIIAANLARFLEGRDLDITTEVAALATLALCLYAVQGSMIIAAAAAAVMVALLDMKQRLHAALTRIESAELKAAIQLLVISVVVLPLLPDRGFGPGGALNPYLLWWLVIIVAAISFAGYTAVKLAGPSLGLLITGFFAGLVSSTALTVSLARRSRHSDIPAGALTAGIAIGTGVMFLRLLILLWAVKPALGAALAPSFIPTALVAFGAALILNRRTGPVAGETAAIGNPLDLSSALLFGALLAIVTLLVYYARSKAGDAGLYGLAALAGLVDVDALSLSTANAANVPLTTATTAVLIVSFVNTGWKIGLAGFFGSPRFAALTARAILPALAVGGAAAVLL